MFKRNASIKQIAKEVADRLAQEVKVEKLILFGSYAYGSPHEHSDFDIAVISEDFERMDFWARIELFAKTALSVDSRLELIGFSKKEYQKPDAASFLAFIKKKGKVVFSKN